MKVNLDYYSQYRGKNPNHQTAIRAAGTRKDSQKATNIWTNVETVADLSNRQKLKPLNVHQNIDENLSGDTFSV